LRHPRGAILVWQFPAPIVPLAVSAGEPRQAALDGDMVGKPTERLPDRIEQAHLITLRNFENFIRQRRRRA
jgi:hypothetical protein